MSALADGLDLAKLQVPLRLTAIPKSDNGKAVGMAATLTKDSLTYKAVKGSLHLMHEGSFDLAKMNERYQSVYKNADGAHVYAVTNWEEIAASNKHNIHIRDENAPKFVYVYKSKYIPTGQRGIFVCLISNMDFENFMSTGSGHGRCDVFKDK
ncbi:hypothetical protein AAIH70_25370 [Neorhizobium sp. BT27B]|uniref:hypothetical protein n=1 Tax=Neorhizobium sp. BT27B TaxID=3142625 RepID=UPI003D28E11A